MMNLSMSELIILAILLIIVVSVAYLMRRVNYGFKLIDQSLVSSMGYNDSFLAQSIYDQQENELTQFNPLKLMSFKDSLDLNKYNEAFRKASDQMIRNDSKLFPGDSLIVGKELISLSGNKVEMTVHLSKKGKELLTKGKGKWMFKQGSGEKLPVLIGEGGKISEIAKEGKYARLTKTISKTATIAVAAAHIISAADLAERLKRVESKIDKLVAFRKIDQMARLERIYISARDLMSLPRNYLTEWEMFRLRSELRELRATWRQEYTYNLGQIKNPTRLTGWFMRKFKKSKLADNVKGEFTEAEIEILFIEYALRLEILFTQYLEGNSGFTMAISEEIDHFKFLHTLIRKREKELKKKNPKLVLTPTIKRLGFLINEYESQMKVSQEPIEIFIKSDPEYNIDLINRVELPNTNEPNKT